MTDRPITPEQALLAVKAAGLDPHKSLNEQIRGDRNGALERQVANLSERVNTLTETLGATGQPPQPHEQLAERLHSAQSEWVTLGGPDGESSVSSLAECSMSRGHASVRRTVRPGTPDAHICSDLCRCRRSRRQRKAAA